MTSRALLARRAGDRLEGKGTQTISNEQIRDVQKHTPMMSQFERQDWRGLQQVCRCTYTSAYTKRKAARRRPRVH